MARGQNSDGEEGGLDAQRLQGGRVVGGEGLLHHVLRLQDESAIPVLHELGSVQLWTNVEREIKIVILSVNCEILTCIGLSPVWKFNAAICEPTLQIDMGL